MEVVQDEHDRPGFDALPEELGGRVEQLEARRLRLELGRAAQLGEVEAQVGDDLGEIRAAPDGSWERRAATSPSRT